jgi:IstB-like ATP binding protein
MAARHQPAEPAAAAAIEAGCRTLRLPTMRTRFAEIAAAAEREQLTYLGFLAELVMAECDDRTRRRASRRLAAGRVSPPQTARGVRLHRQPRNQPGHHPPTRRLRMGPRRQTCV